MDRFVIAKIVKDQPFRTFYGDNGFGPLESARHFLDRAEAEKMLANLPKTGPNEQYQLYYISEDGKHISPVM